jgi:hypothetical protein
MLPTSDELSMLNAYIFDSIPGAIFATLQTSRGIQMPIQVSDWLYMPSIRLNSSYAVQNFSRHSTAILLIGSTCLGFDGIQVPILGTF